MIKQTFRLIYLIFRYNLDEFFLTLTFFKIIHFLRWLNPWYIVSNRFIPRGKRLATALQKAGPLFIKFGQILSTRHDILPDDIIQSLILLQDNVSPFSAKLALHKIKSEFGKEKYDHFKFIDPKPLASASIAQVHAASLKNGDNVVIKILRPHIHQQLKQNIALLRLGAQWLEKKVRKKQRKQTSPLLMVNEIESIVQQEVNLLHEAAHAEQLKENVFAKIILKETLVIPDIYWEYTTKNVLTLQRIYGTPILHIEKIKQAGVDCHQLARSSITAFFTQIFHDNYFHADLHPGNIFINLNNPQKPLIELVDFGIIGSLRFKDRRYIAENIVALMERDYRKVARLHYESGWITSDTAEIPFAYTLKAVCDPILNKPLNEISLGALLLGLIHVAREYEIQLQPQLLLLQKTILNIESLCRLLDPTFNLWDVIRPILTQWLREQLGPKAIIALLQKKLLRTLRDLLDEE